MSAKRENVRVVLDTNVVISGLLWRGPSHRILARVESGEVESCATSAMLDELREVLSRPKFRVTINRRQTSVDEMMAAVIAHVFLCEPIAITPPRTLRDPDDAIILSCAASAQATYITSGDDDLLSLGDFQGIRIVSPSAFLSEMGE